MSNRHTVVRLSFSAIIAIMGLSISMLSYAQEASSSSQSTSSSSSSSSSSSPSSSSQSSLVATGTESIDIEQHIDGATDFTALGTWVLKKPDYSEQSGKDENTSIHVVTPGNHTILINNPDGMSVTVTLYRNGTEAAVSTRPQLNFQVQPGDVIRLVLRYKLSNVGKVGVNSDPSGLAFTLRGPNNSVFTGVTPVDYELAPAGAYSVTYETPADCPKAPAKSLLLKAKSRVVFMLNLDCKGADDLRANPPAKSSSSTSSASSASKSTLPAQLAGSATEDESTSSAPALTVPGTMIDVPPNSWFAPHIYKAASRGIITGYKDESGQPTGMFGPSNLVTLYELSVIAHRISGISEQQYAGMKPTNSGALNYWFTPYYVSAEQRGWTVYQDPLIDPLRFASRAEVVVTLLQALDIPLQWPKGTLFTDVTARTPHAGAIETAAGIGMIEGRKDANGVPLRLFVPLDPINRAELAKIVNILMDR